MKIDTKHFEEKLLQEKARLEESLSSIGRRNPDNPEDWEAIPEEEIGGNPADPNDQADSVEEYESRTATVKELETSLQAVKEALEKIEKGTYGICEVSGEPIEEDRLEANPAAKTCKSHIEE